MEAESVFPLYLNRPSADVTMAVGERLGGRLNVQLIYSYILLQMFMILCRQIVSDCFSYSFVYIAFFFYSPFETN